VAVVGAVYMLIAALITLIAALALCATALSGFAATSHPPRRLRSPHPWRAH
jgi:hypothetical protein